MKKVAALVAGLILLTYLPAYAADFRDGSVAIDVAVRSIDKAVTEGGNTRGPALALLKDDTVLLGGGRSGGELLTWNKNKSALRSLGKFIPANRRMEDSRFAINDIAVLSENVKTARLLISYPRLGAGGSCVEIAVDELVYDRSKQRVRFAANWFVSKPCVPISAVQHSWAL